MSLDINFLCCKFDLKPTGEKVLEEKVICDILMVFSPKVMKWSDDTWIVDLTKTNKYWSQKLTEYNQVTTKNNSFGKMFTKILDKAFLSIDLSTKDMERDRHSDDFEIGKVRPYFMAIAKDPWAAILIVSQIFRRRLSGVTHERSSIAKKVLREMSWDSLWSVFSDYVHILEEADFGKNKIKDFHKNFRAFRLAVLRLNIKSPFELKDVDEIQVGRRFGSLCSLMWEWTRKTLIFHQENTRSDGVTGFLWFPYESKAHLEVTTHLDFVAQRWSEIEEIFRQDLIRLCLMDGWGEEDKVVCLEWSVVTDKATVCPILINFRMPHHLRGENPHHKTTLRQAHYSFEKIDYYLSGFNLFKIKSILDNTEDSVQIEDDLDSLGESGIVSWDLKIKDRVIVPSYMKTLFGFQSSNSSLYSLMNRVKVDMWSFDFMNDWLPEDSFRRSVDIIGVDSLVDQPGDDSKYEKKAHRGKKKSSENLPKNTTSKSTSSRYLLPYFDRPLFLFESSQPTSIPQGPMIFKERTLDKWWKSKDGNYRRDYYINFLDNKCFWVYKDINGKWHKHGIFS